MPANHEQFMRMAIEEAAKGGSEGNSAVGSVIVREGNIVAVGRNLVTSTNDPTAHAKTVALREAGHDWLHPLYHIPSVSHVLRRLDY